MKKILLFFFGVMMVCLIHSQAPQAFNYQAVARNNAGSPLLNSSVAIRVSIHDGSAGGTVVYAERDTATTNSLGVFTCKIGMGNVISGNFGIINWGGGDKYMQVELDPTGGSSYTDMGTSQLLSVPYALNAGNGYWAQTGGGDIHNSNPGSVGIGVTYPSTALEVANRLGNVHPIFSGPVSISAGAIISSTITSGSTQNVGLYAFGDSSTIRNYGLFGDVGGGTAVTNGRNYGVYGLAWRSSAARNIGVYGYADSSAYNSIGVAGSGMYGTNSIGVWGETQDGAAGYFTSFGTGYGLIVSGGNAGFGTTSPDAPVAAYSNANNYTAHFQNALSTSATGVLSDATSTGFAAAIHGTAEYTGSANPSFTYGGRFIATGGTQDVVGVYGFVSGSSGGIRTGLYGSTAGGYSYVCDEINNRKITGTGSVSEIIPTANHGRITLTCPESPEYWYQDYGTVQVVNGKAHVNLDPILADIIVVDAANPLKVFCQDNMLNSNGFAVINKTATGFDIAEKNGGTHSGEVDYTLVAKPKTNYGEGRFMQAPGPGFLKADKTPAAARAANRGHYESHDKIFTWPTDWDVYHYDPADYTEVGNIVEGGPKEGLTKMADGSFKKVIVENKNTKVSPVTDVVSGQTK